MTIRCPVCWRTVPIGIRNAVGKHRDTAGHSCPMAGHQYPNDDMGEAA